MPRGGSKLFLNKINSSKKGIQKQLVQSKAVKEIICTICNKQASIGICLKRHKNHVLNKSPKLSKCNVCGKKFKLKKYMNLQSNINDYRPHATPSKCLPCRGKEVIREKKIMIVKIRKLMKKTEILLTKCASSEIGGIVEFLESVKARLVTLRTNLHSVNVAFLDSP